MVLVALGFGAVAFFEGFCIESQKIDCELSSLLGIVWHFLAIWGFVAVMSLEGCCSCG